MLPILVNERSIEATVIKKANQFVSFKFGDIQLLDIMNFPGGASSLDSFLKAYKSSETKGFFTYEWFDQPNKKQKTELPQYDAFYSKLRTCNPLETEDTDYVDLLKSGLTTEQAVIKLKVSMPPPTGFENYHYLQQTWKQEQMSLLKEFLRWYKNKDVVPTLEAMQNMVDFYHDIDIDMLKLGFTLPNLANICLNKSNNAKLVLERGGDGPLEKYRGVLNEKVNVTSNNRRFRTNNHSVATYDQVKKGLSYFYPKRIVETDGIHTQPLIC